MKYGASRWSIALVCLAIAGSLSRAAAQAEPMRGPADIMNKSNESRDQAELQRAVRAGDGVAKAALPDGGASNLREAEQQTGTTPPASGTGAAEPAAEAPHAMDDGHGHRAADAHAALAEPKPAVAEPLASLAPGSILVEVTGPDGQPRPGAEIVLGIMKSLGGRTEERAKAGPDGRYLFEKLPVGTQQAYRVNVLSGGAKFSTTPFRLPDDKGYSARVPVQPTTSDTRMLFQMIGQTVIELRDDRLHVTQQARLANAGREVIVLPKEGLTVPLPKGFTAFNWQEQMSDQKGEALAETGFRLRGSVPSGAVTLAWTFDLPRDGDSAKIAISQPWRTYQYRVISEAPPGLKLRASGFPDPQPIEEEGRDLLYTEVQHAPNDPSFNAFTIKLDGIPGPGPGRWIALTLALLAIAFGAVRALSPADDQVDRKLALGTRKSELIALAKQTEGEHERGEIGPQFRAERLDEILTELALVLRDEDVLTKRS